MNRLRSNNIFEKEGGNLFFSSNMDLVKAAFNFSFIFFNCQVLNAAWDACIPVASENALPCYDREGYNKILENAKPRHDPDGRHLSVFTYLRLSPALMERHNFIEFERFVKRMHGDLLLYLSLNLSVPLPSPPYHPLGFILHFVWIKSGRRRKTIFISFTFPSLCLDESK